MTTPVHNAHSIDAAQIDLTQHQYADQDPIETQEWLQSLNAVQHVQGKERAQFLVEQVVNQSRENGNKHHFSNTPYRNTIPVSLQPQYPGDMALERKIRSYIRWNAVATVVKANRGEGDLGGHIASFASVSTLFDVGFNHFWKGPNAQGAQGGDLLFFQGHSSPGVYSRAFMEGRLTEQHLNHFRRDVSGIIGGENFGLTSYPHPKLMPEFWQFPTVSMGLGPLQGIYQARFLKYLHARGLADTSGRKVWVFCGDGEMDEPESLGAIGLAAREGLDNLVFVINCNLQRLDGPVRGNGKIIQELEGTFNGAGWNTIKLVWGRKWDDLLAKDGQGYLQRLMDETVDGEYQNFKANDGAFVRERFFSKFAQTKELVAHLSDDEIWALNRGGHDPIKIYTAYHQATQNAQGKPTVILAKTVKGYGLGKIAEGRNTSHQQKKIDTESLMQFRDRFDLPLTNEQVENLEFCKPSDSSEEMQYLQSRREALGGYMPQRRTKTTISLPVPALESFKPLLEPTAENREMSTTMAFVRLLTLLLRDKAIAKHIVPIIPDEARTFGMEGMFRQLGIYSSKGQLYEPVDRDQVMYYREDKQGQILEEGINEAGAFSSWIAASTSYSVSNVPMIPFYIYYSMFGFQRIGDLAWAAGDQQSRGFLLGATSGRTTLNGEGLQHQDGHGHILAATIPNCVSYDPTFAYELAIIIQDGLKRMIGNQENIFYYISVMNENYPHLGWHDLEKFLANPESAENQALTENVLKGLYCFSKTEKAQEHVQLMGCGTILREVMAASELLKNDWNVSSDLWSATSFNELRREGLDIERDNLLNPLLEPKISHVTKMLQTTTGPIIAATDYMKTYADQIRAFIPTNRLYRVLGTDGFGRSDTRDTLRHHFEVDRYFVTIAALQSLAQLQPDNQALRQRVADAIVKYNIDIQKMNPQYA